MGDALMTMFWAGLAAGCAIGMGIFGAIGAVWWWWPQHDDIGHDDESPLAADDYVPVPLTGWDADV